MPVFVGPFDIVQLMFGTINALLKKGLLSYEEAKDILRESLNSELPDLEKERILDSVLTRK